MKDICTFETAGKLKEAGFPQPKVEPGQFWWFTRFPDGLHNRRVLCVATEAYTDGVKQPGLKFVSIQGSEFEGLIVSYAPTATDILRELGWIFELGLGEDGRWMAMGFVGTADEVYHMEENPAEACAAAWLELQAQ